MEPLFCIICEPSHWELLLVVGSDRKTKASVVSTSLARFPISSFPTSKSFKKRQCLKCCNVKTTLVYDMNKTYRLH